MLWASLCRIAPTAATTLPAPLYSITLHRMTFAHDACAPVTAVRCLFLPAAACKTPFWHPCKNGRNVWGSMHGTSA